MKYSNDNELRNIITTLAQDTSNENAFHKSRTDGWNSVALIFTDKSKDEIIDGESRIDALFEDNDYKFILKSSEVKDNVVIEAIYSEISDNNIERQLLDYSESENIAIIESITINNDCMINILLEEDSEDALINHVNGDFIQGNIIANNVQVTENVTVTLINSRTNENVDSVITNTGEYKLAYPGNGTYKIQFKFAGDEINGQNYEISSNYKSINETTNKEENTVNPSNTNTNNLKEEFRSIDYSIEERLNNPSECALIAYTDEFYVDNPLNKKFGSVVLIEREKFKLEVNSTITAYKLVLETGQVLEKWNRESTEESDIVSNVEKPLIITLDSELRYGATVYIEYLITVANKGNIDCTGFTLVSGNDLAYDENAILLTNGSQINGNFGWETSGISNNYVSNTLGSERAKDSYIKLKCDSISAGESKEYKYIASKLLAEDSVFYNVSEIVQYSNEEGRRNFDENGDIKSLAGSYWNTNTSESKNEADTGISEKLFIMPPFGVKYGIQYLIYLLYILMFLLICNIIYIKLKNKRRKR